MKTVYLELDNEELVDIFKDTHDCLRDYKTVTLVKVRVKETKFNGDYVEFEFDCE